MRSNRRNRQTDLLLKAWDESGKVSVYRKLHDDRIGQGKMCSEPCCASHRDQSADRLHKPCRHFQIQAIAVGRLSKVPVS